MTTDDAMRHLRAMTAPGSVGLTAAFLRASVDDDHGAILDLVRGLDDSDDVLSVLLHAVRIAGVALVQAEGSREQAHLVVDSLAALDRWEARHDGR